MVKINMWLFECWHWGGRVVRCFATSYEMLLVTERNPESSKFPIRLDSGNMLHVCLSRRPRKPWRRRQWRNNLGRRDNAPHPSVFATIEAPLKLHSMAMKQDDVKSYDNPPRLLLRGVLKLIEPHCNDTTSLVHFPYNEERMLESHTMLQSRRKRRLLHNSSNPTTIMVDDDDEEEEKSLTTAANNKGGDEGQEEEKNTFAELCQRHKFVCFFILQEGPVYYSKHVMELRKRLSLHYNDCMTTFVVNLNNNNNNHRGGEDDTSSETASRKNVNLFSHFGTGTGFTYIRPTSSSLSIFMALLNVTQVPTIIIFDTSTGRPISGDAKLALEWNEPHDVLQAWHVGHSGLTTCQKLLAVVTCQSSDCTIL